jgi:N-acetylglucosamine kinase-like BadF-type ATPase
MTEPLLLAVDGGGTKTQALVADMQGKVVARGLAPSSNIHNVGFEAACKAVMTAVEGALMNVSGQHARTGGPSAWKNAFSAACFGLSGVDSKEDEMEMARWVKSQALTSRFVVVNDSELVLAAGTPDGWGVAVISGTGSVCLGRGLGGRSARVGGWGPLLGDEGSGYYIAVSALRLASRAADGRAEAPALLKAVLRHWSLSTPEALIRHVHAPGMTAAEIAGLASVVLDLATRGDAPARAIVDDAAKQLAQHVETVVRKLGLDKPPLALSGGLLRGQLRQGLVSSLHVEIGNVAFVADPALGAVVLARRLLERPSATG